MQQFGDWSYVAALLWYRCYRLQASLYLKYFLITLFLNPGQSHVLSISGEHLATSSHSLPVFERVWVQRVTSAMEPKIIIICGRLHSEFCLRSTLLLCCLLWLQFWLSRVNFSKSCCAVRSTVFEFETRVKPNKGNFLWFTKFCSKFCSSVDHM